MGRKLFLLTALTIVSISLFSEKARAQAIRLPNNTVYIKKTSANEFFSEIKQQSYRFENNGTVVVIKSSGEEEPVARYEKKSNGNIAYYDTITEEYKGEFSAADNRFLDSKEGTVAAINGNELLDASGSMLFLFDKELPMLELGYFVYFTY